MMNLETIACRLATLESCSASFEFPAGGCVSIPLESELELVEMLRGELRFAPDELSQARQNRSLNECYGSVVFSARMGILAVRTSDIELFRVSLRAFLFEAGQVDYRDLLGALSVLELCAQRLQLQFQNEMTVLSDKLDDRTRATVEGYFERPEGMRKVEAMGFVAEEREEGFTISSRN